MGEILQDAERYFLQLWDEYYNRWNELKFFSHDDVVKMKEQITADDTRWGRKTQCRIVKETTKQEVVYND
jgi:hypothetical protein